MAIISKRYAHLNQADSGSLHRKLDATEAYITGSFTAASDAHIVGVSQHDAIAKFGDVATTLTDTAAVVGAPALTLQSMSSIIAEKAAIFGAQVFALGGVTLNDTLMVAGGSELSGSVTMDNDLTVQGQLTVHSAAEMHDVLPHGDLAYDLGSAAARWAEIHAGTAAFEHLEVDYLDVAVTASVAQLTGSAGAVFSAGDIIATLGKISASAGNLEAGGQLVVAGNADLNGQLDVALASDLHGAVTVYSTLNVQGAVDLDTTLNVDGIAQFQDDVYAKADLNVSGALEVALTANVAGNFSVATNKFTVAASSGDTSVAGDLMVSGDLTVMGDRIEAQVTQLVIEDGLITLMSGSTGRALSNDAGIEVEVGANNGDMPAIKFASALGGASGSWVSNLDWIPSEDLKYDLGIQAKRWRELNLSGNANVGGDLAVAGSADLAAVAAESLAVAGAATFAAGIAVTGTGSFTGAIDAASATLAGALSADSATIAHALSAETGSFSGDLSVAGNASVTGSLSVTGAANVYSLQATDSIAAGGDLSTTADLSVGGNASVDGTLAVTGASTLADLAVTGLSDLNTLQVTGPATFAQSIAVTGSGSFTGDLSAASASFSGDLDVYGTATFHGVFAVPGAGDFGSLTVGGINMSPISSSNPISTVDSASTTMITQALVNGDMAKYEIEVTARGRGTQVGDNSFNAAAWKISVAAMHKGGSGIDAAATELSKESFGALGANLDVDIQVSGDYIEVIAKGAQGAGTVFWDCQIVKKMVMSSDDGSRKY